MRITTLLDARNLAQSENALYYMAGRSIENVQHILDKHNHATRRARFAFRAIDDQFTRRARLIETIDKRINGAVIVDLRKPLEGFK